MMKRKTHLQGKGHALGHKKKKWKKSFVDSISDLTVQ